MPAANCDLLAVDSRPGGPLRIEKLWSQMTSKPALTLFGSLCYAVLL